MCAVAPSGECLQGKSPPDQMLAIPWRHLFLAAFGLNLVVVALLRDSYVCHWLLSCVTDCCEVERSVLTTINKDVMLCMYLCVIVSVLVMCVYDSECTRGVYLCVIVSVLVMCVYDSECTRGVYLCVIVSVLMVCICVL